MTIVVDADIGEYLRRIHDRYPALAITSARVEPVGQRSVVLVVNETISFRFPRTAEDVATLAIEASLLRALRDRLPVPTPDPVYEDLRSSQVGMAFLGYPRLPGEPLWRNTFLSQDHTTRDALAAQIAGFLRALHSVPIDALPPRLPVNDGRDRWDDLYRRIRASLFPLMRAESRVAVAGHFAAYLETPDDPDYRAVLRHGDFGPSNILFDAETRTISGIVDFGSAGLGDPALDIAGLIGPAGYGEAFASAFVDDFRPTRTLMRRARFYAGTFALQEALWGLEHGDPSAFELGIDAYR
jgi:aminoglycoside 2''-phosphotransferase